MTSESLETKNTKKLGLIFTSPILPEEIRPGEIVHGLLFGLDRPSDNLRIEMVGQDIVETGLDGERFVQELLVEMLLDIVHKDRGHAALIILGSTFILKFKSDTVLASNMHNYFFQADPIQPIPALPIICSTSVMGMSTYLLVFPS